MLLDVALKHTQESRYMQRKANVLHTIYLIIRRPAADPAQKRKMFSSSLM
jgi:hypothetical protein